MVGFTPQENRRQFPDRIRQMAALHDCAEVNITMDTKSALELAKDIEFAVKYREMSEAGKFLPPILKASL